jgi:hypothetical protein
MRRRFTIPGPGFEMEMLRRSSNGRQKFVDDVGAVEEVGDTQLAERSDVHEHVLAENSVFEVWEVDEIQS